MDRQLETPKVKDIFIKKVIAFRPDFTIFDAIRNFNKFNISAAPVVTENNEVIGYLSESDCIKCMSNCLFYDEARNDTIDLIMNKNVALAESEWDIFELESFFCFKSFEKCSSCRWGGSPCRYCDEKGCLTGAGENHAWTRRI